MKIQCIPNRNQPYPKELTVTKRTDIKSVLIIGSGPILIGIGQACEFNYSGTLAAANAATRGIAA